MITLMGREKFINSVIWKGWLFYYSNKDSSWVEYVSKPRRVK